MAISPHFCIFAYGIHSVYELRSCVRYVSENEGSL